MKIVAYILAPALVACDASSQADFNQLQQAHIESNAPEDSEFESILRRDLVSYFEAQLGVPVDVNYDFLRRGPTQSGLAYPKYYLWVIVADSMTRKELSEAGVRVAAIDRTRFDVTHHVTKARIVDDPASLDTIFPPAVIGEIKKRL
jgi:hypothetical protein